jgi:hypothetical protein
MSDLVRVMQLANALVKAQAAEKAAEEELKEAKARRLALEREDLPELMREIGLEQIKLEDGTVVEVKEDCDARISDARAFAWLDEHGYSGLVKTELTIAFPRGEKEEAAQLYGELNSKYGSVAFKETVHPATLKSFVKERLAEGEAIPMDAFGVHPYSKAVIKRGK